MRLRTAIYATLLLGFTSASVAPPAGAVTDEEKAGARTAAIEGKKAFDEGRYADAVDMFSRAEQLIHAPPHLLFLARSYEKLGKLVLARETYLKITRERLEPKSPKAFKKAQDDADEELKALDPRISYVTVTVQGAGSESVAVTMDGARVPDALVGVPRPVDPGEHVFQATAQGMESSPQSVTVKEGSKDTVVLTLQSRPGAGIGAGGAGGGGGGGGAGGTGPGPVADTGGVSGLRIASYVSLGVGVIGGVVGGVFLAQSGSKQDDADAKFDECQRAGMGNCDQASPLAAEVSSLDDDAKSAKTIGIAGVVVGVLGIGTGVTLLIVDLSRKKESGALVQPKPRVTPWIGYRSAGFSGTF